MRYLSLADALRSRLAAGAFGSGGALPSEATIGREHGVSRVTVRRALEVLRDEGVVASRQGAGWFVTADPVRQALGRFTTVEAALEAAGAVPGRRVLSFRYEAADPEVAGPLALGAGDEVLRVRRLTTAGGEPFGVVTVWVPGDLGAPLSRADVEGATFYDLLPRHGTPLARSEVTIAARAAERADARALGVRAGAPVLACRRLTFAVDGRPVVLSEHRYAGERTVFEVELPHPTAAAGLPGVRPTTRNEVSDG
ncbi:MAG: putative GntR family transcriptional regulator [Acidimicrobiales bacterium]|jgi:GntR family transcriptional regulator|nr:putative GntR family transcriptional regulator [Acidimicrobiales bacterium]